MLRLSVALLVLAGVLGFLAVVEWRAGRDVSTQPQELTLSELLARGTQGNPHVDLREFEFDGRFVFAEGRFGSPWRSVWLPVHPPRPVAKPPEGELALGTQNADREEQAGRVYIGDREGQLPGAAREIRRVQALVVSHRLHSGEDVKRFTERRQLQGLVLTDLDQLDRHDLDLLLQKFPRLDLSQCVLIQADRAPRGVWLLLVFGVGAGVSLLGAGGLFRAWRRGPRRRPSPATDFTRN